MTTDRAAKLNAACRAVAAQLLLPTVRLQCNDAPNRRDSARFGTPIHQNDKTNPIPRLPRRWGLAPRRLTAIQLLIDGCSVAKSARVLGIGRRTLFTWLKDATFRKELDRRVAENARNRRDSARNGAVLR